MGRFSVAVDVGGTNSDVGMLPGGALSYTDGRAIAGYPIALSGVEVETVGAGGGSIASINPTGLLKVGPRAGARPDFNSGRNDLAKLRVGVMVSTAAASALQKIPGVTPTTYNTVADEYNDLLLGRIDVVAIESTHGAYVASAT